MEPIAASAPSLIRPVAGVQGDLSGFWREGAVLSGEVLARSDGGTVLLGIGGQRVPAETGVDLDPGERFSVVVERRDGELTLRLLPQTRAARDSSLLLAMRSLLGTEKPLGTLLSDLASLLRSDGSLDPVLARGLASSLDARFFQPGMGGEELRALLTSGGLAYESSLVAAAAEVGADGQDKARSALLNALRELVVRAGIEPTPAEHVALERALATALEALSTERVEPPLTTRTIERLGARLEASLAAALAGDSRGARIARALVSAGPTEWLNGREGALLRGLLNSDGARTTLATTLADTSFASLGRELRGLLALATMELDAGPLREGASRALAGLDLEQLMNAARREHGEPLHYSLPVPDGVGWTTAHLFVMERGRDGDGRERDEQDAYRVVVGVEFSRVGRIRADLALRASRLAVRLTVERPQIAQRLRQAAAGLEERLAEEGRQVLLTICEATGEALDVDHLAHDIRFLREHHLMDVRG